MWVVYCKRDLVLSLSASHATRLRLRASHAILFKANHLDMQYNVSVICPIEMTLYLTDLCLPLMSPYSHYEAESICNIFAAQEPQEALQCPLTHPEEDYVLPPF